MDNPYQPPIEAAEPIATPPTDNKLPKDFWPAVLVLFAFLFLIGLVFYFPIFIGTAVLLGALRTNLVYKRCNRLGVVAPGAFGLLVTSSILVFGLQIVCVITFMVVCTFAMQTRAAEAAILSGSALVALLSLFGLIRLSVLMAVPRR